MHFEAFAFLGDKIKDMPAGLHVLEFGAHDVNGSPRALFKDIAEYFGVDPWPGRGVDWMGYAQDFDGQERFDVVITAEAMEHDADPAGQIASAWLALKPGGTLLITAAAEPRLPHRCNGAQGDTSGEHYANIDPLELADWLRDWSEVTITHDKNHGDVYASAVKPCD